MDGTLDAVRINGADLLEQPWEALKATEEMIPDNMNGGLLKEVRV